MRRSTATAPSSTGTVPDGFPLKVTPLVDRTPDLSCPLLGLFGNDDQFPSPEQVDELEEALKAAGKTYEFHRYDGAGHAFFSVDRPAYRPEAAVDGWQRIFEWYGRYLAGADHVLLPHRRHRVAGSAKGPQGWFRSPRPGVLRPPVPRAVRPHAQHRLHRPGPRARAHASRSSSARTSARRLVESINEALAAAGAAAT